MALARIYSGFTGLGQLIIRALGDVGGPPASRVSEELDNLIAWAKLSPRCIHRNTSTVGNVGAGHDVLHTFSLPANSLEADNDYLCVWYGGQFAANDADKRVNAFFGGTQYAGGGTVDLDASLGWTVAVRIIRLSSTSVRVSHILNANGAAIDSANAPQTFTQGWYIESRSNDITGLANLNSNATTMEVKGESAGATNNDVTQNLSIIELTQQ